MRPHEQLAEIGRRQRANLAELKRLIKETSQEPREPESRRPGLKRVLVEACVHCTE